MDGASLYAPMLLLSVVLGAVAILALVRRDGHSLRRAGLFVFLVLVGSGLCAKLVSIAFHGGLRELETELAGGLRWPGSVLGVVLMGWLFRRVLPEGLSLGRMLDLLTPGYLVSAAIGRLGCLLVGCCYGAVTSLPWGIAYPRGATPWWAHFERGEIPNHAATSLATHPFPIYLFAMEMGLAWVMLHLARRGRETNGEVFVAFLALHGVLKFAIEYTRDPFHLIHQSVLLLSIGAVAFWGLRRLFRSRAQETVPAAT